MSICQLLFLPIIHAIVVLQPVPKGNVHLERENYISHIKINDSQKCQCFHEFISCQKLVKQLFLPLLILISTRR